MFCLTCCATSEETAGNYSTIAVDERDPGLESEPAKYDAGPAKQAMDVIASAPPAASTVTSFSIRLERKKPKAPLGMTLDPSGLDAVYVCTVLQGNTPANEANQTHATPIMPGDFIFSINGVAGDLAAMMQEVQTAMVLDLVVRRPTEFSISINRRGQSVGCAITYDATTGISLVVEAVNDGPVKVWNDCNPGSGVCMGDRIIAVNGVQGSAVELLDQIRNLDDLRLTFVRACPA